MTPKILLDEKQQATNLTAYFVLFYWLLQLPLQDAPEKKIWIELKTWHSTQCLLDKSVYSNLEKQKHILAETV